MTVRIYFCDQAIDVKAGTLLAAALGANGLRRSVGGETRAPFCGMGICFECRLTVDGERQQRSCQIIVREGMRVDREG